MFNVTQSNAAIVDRNLDGVAVAAALQISHALASSYLHYSRALRNPLPLVGAALAAADSSYSMLQTTMSRTRSR